MQALLGFTSEARWLRHVRAYLPGMSPTLPQQFGYNKRVRKLAATIAWLSSRLGGLTSIDDDTWVVDSTPVECGRSRETEKRSDLAGWAQYGCCASHSRFFWGQPLHLVCTLHGLPVGRVFESELAEAGIELLRPARSGEKRRPGARFFKPLRQVIESVNDRFGNRIRRSLTAYDH